MSRSPLDGIEDPSPLKFVLGLIAGALVAAYYSFVIMRHSEWAPPLSAFALIMVVISFLLFVFTPWRMFAIGFLASLPLGPLVFLATCFAILPR